MKEEILRIENVTRKKDGVVCLDNINLHIFKGEIMGMIFLTSRGKDELIELLCNNYPIEYGRIYYKEELVNYYEYSSMSMNQIYVISHNNGLIGNLSVAENIFVMRKGLKKHIINQSRLNKEFYRLFPEGLSGISPEKPAFELTHYERCLVELYRAVVADCKLIVLRDLASFLSRVELMKYYEYIREYSSLGVAFLYLGNHHEEVFLISDRVALVREARIIKILSKEEMVDEHILPYTIPFEVGEPIPGEAAGILTFKQVSSKNMKGVSFSVQKGECVVLLDKGSDIHEDFLDLIYGRSKVLSGSIIYKGKPYTRKEAGKALLQGIMTINKNPIRTMLFWDMNYLENLTFLSDRKLGCSVIKPRILESIVEEYQSYVGREIYTRNLKELEPASLYNLVYYRVHLYNPDLLICIRPFADADMYLRRHIVELLYQLKEKGITIIILSLNVADSLSIADRMMLMEDGRIIKNYEKKDFDMFF